ncbi:MAG: sigma-54-dependent transcriptional regulator [Nitrospinota bacterium]
MAEQPARVLVVDDKADMRWTLTNVLTDAGYAAFEASSGETALALIREKMPQVVLLDIRMPQMDGWEVLEAIAAMQWPFAVIIITAYGDIKSAVRAMKMGAFDYLTKPFDNEEILLTVRRAIEHLSLREEIQELRGRLARAISLEERMGSSGPIRKVVEAVQRVAPTNYTVLVVGKTGTGKELVARAIHQLSSRHAKPFLAIDCGAIPETLLESELFGYEKGAFTGAERRRAGYFEAADGGTLFFDEIGNLPLGLQAKLLRVMEEKTIQMLGSTKVREVDVRVLAASNAPLEEAVRRGQFREDLYYRLAEFTIALPTLSARREDIPFLAKYFLAEANRDLGGEARGITEDALAAMMAYPWPGNVRELRNAIRHAALIGPQMIRREDLNLRAELRAVPTAARGGGETVALSDAVRQSVDRVEAERILGALRATGGNKAEAARILKVDYKTLYRKLKKYGF